MLDKKLLDEFLRSEIQPTSVRAYVGGGGLAAGNCSIDYSVDTYGDGSGSAAGFTFFNCCSEDNVLDFTVPFGYGDGEALGNCSSRSHCKAAGSLNGYYFAEFEGHKVYIIDSVPTCITAVHKAADYMFAEGFLINFSMYKENCIIAKVNGEFAHDVSLRLAVLSALDKFNNNEPLDVKINRFIAEFPNLHETVDNHRLFVHHHLLTGSCTLGRQKFIREHNIDIDGSMTVEDFINLTAYDYNGHVIRELGKQYGMKFDHR